MYYCMNTYLRITFFRYVCDSRTYTFENFDNIFSHLWLVLPLRISPRGNFNRHRSTSPIIAREIKIRFERGICIRTFNEPLNLWLYTCFRIGQINSLDDTLRPFLHVISRNLHTRRVEVADSMSRGIQSSLLMENFCKQGIKYRLNTGKRDLISSKV